MNTLLQTSRPLNIALIGYGKMGKAIEAIAVQRGHQVILKISSSNTETCTVENLQLADIAIEFTNPLSAPLNIKMCFKAGVPVVCGSTGWLNVWDEITSICAVEKGSLLYASNFSIGVNIFFEINRKLAQLMSRWPSYLPSIEETHHTHKKDAPSGTAITLAEGIMEAYPSLEKWSLAPEQSEHSLTITSKRIDPAPGTHVIKYDSPVDSIEISHTAHNREGFALGAVLAAEYLAGRKGIHTMKDVLAIQ